MPTPVVGFYPKLFPYVAKGRFGKKIYLAHKNVKLRTQSDKKQLPIVYSTGSPEGASPFLDSTRGTKGAGATNLLGKWNKVAISSTLRINVPPGMGNKGLTRLT
jgi:hypothetical protein